MYLSYVSHSLSISTHVPANSLKLATVELTVHLLFHEAILLPLLLLQVIRLSFSTGLICWIFFLNNMHSVSTRLHDQRKGPIDWADFVVSVVVIMVAGDVVWQLSLMSLWCWTSHAVDFFILMVLVSMFPMFLAICFERSQHHSFPFCGQCFKAGANILYCICVFTLITLELVNSVVHFVQLRFLQGKID